MYTARDTLHLDSHDRDRLIRQVLGALAEAVPGSTAALRGSLATAENDVYSDIDLTWDLPAENFPPSPAELESILASTGPVESVRSDPEYAHSPRQRLLYIRLRNAPLFWRIDLEVRAMGKGDIRG